MLRSILTTRVYHVYDMLYNFVCLLEVCYVTGGQRHSLARFVMESQENQSDAGREGPRNCWKPLCSRGDMPSLRLPGLKFLILWQA